MAEEHTNTVKNKKVPNKTALNIMLERSIKLPNTHFWRTRSNTSNLLHAVTELGLRQLNLRYQALLSRFSKSLF